MGCRLRAKPAPVGNSPLTDKDGWWRRYGRLLSLLQEKIFGMMPRSLATDN
jgi:hypothetical protein